MISQVYIGHAQRMLNVIPKVSTQGPLDIKEKYLTAGGSSDVDGRKRSSVSGSLLGIFLSYCDNKI